MRVASFSIPEFSRLCFSWLSVFYFESPGTKNSLAQQAKLCRKSCMPHPGSSIESEFWGEHLVSPYCKAGMEGSLTRMAAHLSCSSRECQKGVE